MLAERCGFFGAHRIFLEISNARNIIAGGSATKEEILVAKALLRNHTDITHEASGLNKEVRK